MENGQIGEGAIPITAGGPPTCEGEARMNVCTILLETPCPTINVRRKTFNVERLCSKCAAIEADSWLVKPKMSGAELKTLT